MGLLLCTLNEVKAQLRVSVDESSLDDVLTDTIYGASSKAERDTSRTFTYTVYANDTYQGGGGVVALDNYPVDPLATFQVKDYDATNNTVIFDTSDYAVDFPKGIIRLRGGLRFTHGPDSAQVSYSAGYEPNGSDPTDPDYKISVPDDLSRIVRDYSVALYRRQTGALSEKDFDTAEDRFEMALSPYRRIW